MSIEGFSFIQVLREINFVNLKVYEIVILTVLEVNKFDFWCVLCNFSWLKLTKNQRPNIVSELIKMSVSKTQKLQKLISREKRVTEKSLNFHTVKKIVSKIHFERVHSFLMVSTCMQRHVHFKRPRIIKISMN